MGKYYVMYILPELRREKSLYNDPSAKLTEGWEPDRHLRPNECTELTPGLWRSETQEHWLWTDTEKGWHFCLQLGKRQGFINPHLENAAQILHPSICCPAQSVPWLSAACLGCEHGTVGKKLSLISAPLADLAETKITLSSATLEAGKQHSSRRPGPMTARVIKKPGNSPLRLPCVST